MMTPLPASLAQIPSLPPLSLRVHSRSPSRSPIRRTELTARDLDPLLSDLSPEKTLQAFNAADGLSFDDVGEQSALRKSIEQSSLTDRAFGYRAAVAAQKIKQWHSEISVWSWTQQKGSSNEPTSGDQSALGPTHFANLPAGTVEQYNQRLDEIVDGLDALKVDELKEHLLDAHIPSRSRPGTSSGPFAGSSSGAGHLGDLTTVITATIMQALPYLAELNLLISIWDVRLAVLLPALVNEAELEPETKPQPVYQKPKEPLSLTVSSQGHRREISQVSVADSAFSEAFSDISNAEIVDATSQVLASPTVNVVDNPFRTRLDSIDGAEPRTARVQSMHFPASAKLISASKTSSHLRSQSLTLATMPFDASAVHQAVTVAPEPARPSTATLTTPDSAPPERPEATFRNVVQADEEPQDEELDGRDSGVGYYAPPTFYVPQPDNVPMSAVSAMSNQAPWNDPLDSDDSGAPSVPDMLSSRTSDAGSRPVTALREHYDVSSEDDDPPPLPSTFSPFKTRGPADAWSPSKPKPAEENLDDKIRSILTNLPGKIRLAESDQSDVSTPSQASSAEASRSSTPAPTMTLQRVRAADRSNSTDNGVKVYHLKRSGEPRDAPPTKLHVRTVGASGRVMVRVGGGWADLSEYLREYSLHHGKRNTENGRLEVAGLPSHSTRSVSGYAGVQGSGPGTARSSSGADTGFDFGDLPSIDTRPVARPIQPRLVDGEGSGSQVFAYEDQEEQPAMPDSNSYRYQSPTMTTTIRTTGPRSSTTTTVTPSTPAQTQAEHSNTNTITTTSPTVVTTSSVRSRPISTTPSSAPTAVTPTASTPAPAPLPTYTPLGAAGPLRVAKSRAVTFDGKSTPDDEEAWVASMVGRARQVSSGASVVPSPNLNASHMSSVSGIRAASNPVPTGAAATPPGYRKVVSNANSLAQSSPGGGGVESSPLGYEDIITGTMATPVQAQGQGQGQSAEEKSMKRHNTGNKLQKKKSAGESSASPSPGAMGGIRRVFLRSKKDR